MRVRWTAAGVLVLVFAAATGWGQTSEATVMYHQDRPQLEVQQFTIAVAEDGKSSYHAKLAPLKASGQDADLPAAPQTVVDRPMTLAAGTTKKIFDLARAADRFQIVCASKAKNVADTGAKKLSYRGPDGSGECSYNYSESKPVAELTDVFQGIEMTMEIGRKLEFLRRFDRLGLDAEITSLAGLVADHRAWGVEAIAATLRSIANDTELLQRVRTRAGKLVEQVESAR